MNTGQPVRHVSGGTTRVRLQYTIEVAGAVRTVELPFITGILADLSGAPQEPLPRVDERRFAPLSADTFGSLMARISPCAVASRFRVTFKSLDDFRPEAVAEQIPPISKLDDWTNSLIKLLELVKAGSPLEDCLDQMLLDVQILSKLATSEAQYSSLAAYIDESIDALQRAAQYARQETDPLAASTLASTLEVQVENLKWERDRQINLVLHDGNFQRLEATWRGLHYLAVNTETDEMLQLRVLDISKAELEKTLRKYQGVSWDQSPLFKKIYDEGLGTQGGHPFGCLIGDYFFDHSPADLRTLGEIGKICEAAGVPFLSAAEPTSFGMDTWRELVNPRSLTKIFQTPEYAAWRSLREADVARFIFLTLPRFLIRLPYVITENQQTGTRGFVEDIGQGDHRNYLWTNAAYAMAVNIHRSFKRFGWFTRIAGVDGGMVENLPVHTIVDAEQVRVGPTEVAIDDRREAELASCGFLPLVSRGNSRCAVFVSLQSLNRPIEFTDAESTENVRRQALLTYILTLGRIVHYVKSLMRDNRPRLSQTDGTAWLNEWLQQYVDSDPALSSDNMKAQRPLAEARITEASLESPNLMVTLQVNHQFGATSPDSTRRDAYSKLLNDRAT
jgi:type VI secretion system protein ImpC